MTRRRTVLSSALAAVVTGGGIGAVWLAADARPDGGAPVAADVPTSTAEVTRGTVAERVQTNATLGYGAAYAVTHLGEPGVLTAIAAPETALARGVQLYAVANETVRLLYGAIPAYRDFALGMMDGPDVKQLKENLVALGLDPTRQLTTDGHFTAATAAAIRRWQAAWGLPASQRTGTLPLGRVVFQPGALRITEAAIPAGATVRQDEPVLTVTSTAPVVTAQLSPDRRRLVRVGDRVSVTIAGLPSFPGTIVSISRTAAAANSSGGGGGGNPPPTIAVTISATPPANAGEVDQTPVLVAITRQTRENVLTVPIVALLARPGGGYQVRLDTGGYVPVEPGLFDSTTGRVEVSGELTAGQKVKVPAR